jgi:lipopolysaccharide transport system ATP-binding protein
MDSAAIVARDVSKIYRVYPSPWHRLREALFRKSSHREFVALRDVTFTLPPGEGLAVIGENGAGKSTLLKILSGVTSPTHGTATTHGRIASILELGSGFHPEFTGRQNAMLNAAMLGLSPEDVRSKMPEIIAWSELGDFIDRPVKTYSTGMAMRLGFSIATQVEPQILIIDEALSVGDGYFQKKCMDRLMTFVSKGGTLLFCSHAMYYVSSFCQHALWLRNGRPEALGPAADVVRSYEEFLQGKSNRGTPTVAVDQDLPRAPARLQTVELVKAADREPLSTSAPGPAVYRKGDRWELLLTWESLDPALAFHVGVGLNRADEVEVCTFSTKHDGQPPWRGEGQFSVRLLLPELPLVKGEFTVHAFLLAEEALHIYDHRILPGAFRVESPSYAFGLVAVEHSWVAESSAEHAPAALSARH